METMDWRKIESTKKAAWQKGPRSLLRRVSQVIRRNVGVVLAGACLTASGLQCEGDPRSGAEARARWIAELPVVDLHNDRSFYLSARGIPWPDCRRAEICAERYERAQYFFAVFRPPLPLKAGPPWRIRPERLPELNRISHLEYVRRAAAELRAATGVAVSRDPQALGAEGERIFLGLEGAFLLDDRPAEAIRARPLDGTQAGRAAAPDSGRLEAHLLELKSLGFSYVGLVWMNDNPYAGVSSQPEKGLTDAGRMLARLLIRHGLLIDLSHASDQTVRDVFAFTRGRYPLFFSHSSVRALCDHERNLSDELLELTRRSGGLVGVNFYTQYIACAREARTEDVLAHLDYLRGNIGQEHTALGSDFDGLITLPQGLEHPGDLRALAGRLLDEGYASRDIEALYFRNMRRVLARAQSLDEAAVFGAASSD